MQKIKKSTGTVKAEFKASNSQREDRLIARIDSKRERPKRPVRGEIRTYRGNQYKKDYSNE